MPGLAMFPPGFGPVFSPCLGRVMQKNMIVAINAIPAIPPTTPPTIGPTWLGAGAGVGGRVEVVEEMGVDDDVVWLVELTLVVEGNVRERDEEWVAPVVV
jgi:hypothetical protein